MEDRIFDVYTVEEYISAIKEIYKQNESSDRNGVKTKHLFFRGHSKRKYELIPTIIRQGDLSEKDILLDFVHYGPQHNIKYDFERERINILTDMQHKNG